MLTVAENTQSKGSKATNFGIVAWVTYGTLGGFGHWTWGALGAIAIALAIVAHEYSRNAIKMMDCITAGYFAIVLVTTIAFGPWLFKTCNIFLSWGAFAIVTWAGLIRGFPFTIQYAREKAPPEVWEHPLFIRLNVILTVVFGVMFSVNTVLGATALMTGHLLSLGVALPLSLLVAAIAFSNVYPKRYFERVAPQWAAAAQGAQAGGRE
jgi:hypothetical protein